MSRDYSKKRDTAKSGMKQYILCHPVFYHYVRKPAVKEVVSLC
jgi:hypothetical protein